MTHIDNSYSAILFPDIVNNIINIIYLLYECVILYYNKGYNMLINMNKLYNV